MWPKGGQEALVDGLKHKYSLLQNNDAHQEATGQKLFTLNEIFLTALFMKEINDFNRS